ncbi:MAG: hypothetical protein JWQ21_2161 [Herminiimonas sp.]|nr:hypothetical protein [Herminiimonas sp.]
MSKTLKISPLLAMLLLGACTTMPSGPSTLVLPGTGKSFDQFRADDFECRQFAQGQLGGATANSVVEDSGVRSAALGTLLGAVAGAAANGSRGAGVGAGAGLALGGLAGTSAGQASAYGVQQRYDFGYQQCMYAKGNRVPVTASRFMTESRQYQGQSGAYQSGAYNSPPPPPPGTPPGPPPR